MSRHQDDPPFDGGSQSVTERPPEAPGGGRTVVQTVVTVIGVLAVLAALLWLLVPMLAG